MSIVSSLTILVGIVVFAFVFWRRLKEDYSQEQIFYLTLLFIFGGVVGSLLADKIAPNFAFWGFFAGFTLLGIYGVARLKFKFFEVLDGAVYALFLFLAIGSVSQALGRLVKFDIIFLLRVAAIFLAIFAFWFFARSFRTFSWYPSGKIGFIGLATLCVFFIARTLIDFYFLLVLKSWFSVPDLVFSVILAGVLAVIIYLRSGRLRAEKTLSFFKKKR